MKLTVTINGKPVQIDMSGNEILLDLLRREGYFGVKRGCENGDCGSCAVMVDGRAMCSCLMMAGQVEGRDVLTIEGMGDPVNPHPLQQTFVDCGAAQCGFCIPGMIVAAKELIDDVGQPTQEQMMDKLDGNLCRCTGYTKQFDAVREAAVLMARDVKAKKITGVKGLARPAKAPAVVLPKAEKKTVAAKAKTAVKKAVAKAKPVVKKAAAKAKSVVKKAVKTVKKLAAPRRRAERSEGRASVARGPGRSPVSNKKGGRR